MTMIEKVAIALAPQAWACYGRMIDNVAQSSRRKASLRHARLAIEAMREPTDEMQMIYYELNHKCGTFDVSTWERSIDAALKE